MGCQIANQTAKMLAEFALFPDEKFTEILTIIANKNSREFIHFRG